MRETDNLLVNSYASFLINPTTLKILDYNDYGNRYIKNELEDAILISNIVEWDSSITKSIDFQKDKKMILASKDIQTNNELILIVQKITYKNEVYFNVTLVDNLEDIRDFENKSINHELSRSSLFSNIFKYSPIGLVLVDSETNLYKANKYMFDCFNLESEEVIGQRFGNVFGCSTVSESRLLCGEANGCKDCQLRNGVTAVLSNESSLEGVEIGHDFEINGRTVTKWFTVSASQVAYGEEKYALVSFVDITQRVRMEERLRELGITDPLTQLYNRRHIMNLYSESLLSSKYTHVSVSLIDIDNFKMVNDDYGHLEGDKVLMLLGDILKEQLRYSDYAGRYGGEEFLIILPDTTLDYAEQVLTRIQAVFKERSNILIGKPLTFSVGLIEASDLEVFSEADLRMLLNRTDQFMYQAKAKGKDRIESTIFRK